MVRRSPLRWFFDMLLRITNSPRAVLFGYVILLTASAAIYGWVEHQTVGESVWWAVVTASTVGYGDTYPLTVPGRIVGAALITVMVLVVIPLVTAHFASRLIVDSDAFKHEEQEEIKQNLRFIRAHLEGAHRDGEAVPPRIEEPAGSLDR
jgi:voltage-gated potassium channel